MAWKQSNFYISQQDRKTERNIYNIIGIVESFMAKK